MTTVLPRPGADLIQHVLAFDWIIVTPSTFVSMFVSAFTSFYVMAVLVQLPRTTLYRAALLPVVFWSGFRAYRSLDFSGNDPSQPYLNQGFALSLFTFAMRGTAWALAQRPYRRLPTRKSGNDTTKDPRGTSLTESDVSVFSAMWNAWDLMLDLRGIGWHGPEKVQIPKRSFHAESRQAFVLLSLSRSILWMLAFDVLRTCTSLLGPTTFATPEGGTIFDSSLDPVQRYLKSSAVTILVGFGAYLVIDATYHLHAALNITLFLQHPSQWPPLFDFPFLSTSLIVFWGKGWHQLFRDCFVAAVGKHMMRYFGRAGLVIGVFALSGLFHDIGVRGMGRGTYTPQVFGFFFVQGVGVIMEIAWKRITGKRVSGFVGWLWMSFWLILWGNFLADAWARLGMLGVVFPLEAYRPGMLFLKWMS